MTEESMRSSKPLVLSVDDISMTPMFMRETLQQASFDVEEAGDTIKVWVTYQNTGLGLAWVREIEKDHGGLIRVESTVDLGSASFFTLSTVDQIILEQSSPLSTSPQQLRFQSTTKINQETDRVLL